MSFNFYHLGHPTRQSGSGSGGAAVSACSASVPSDPTPISRRTGRLCARCITAEYGLFQWMLDVMDNGPEIGEIAADFLARKLHEDCRIWHVGAE